MSGVLWGAQSVVEVPLRIQNVYLRRLPGNFEFFFVGRIPNGQLFALPESEIQRFVDLAEENGFGVTPGDYAFLPKETALGHVANATVTVEHTDQLRFWRNEYGVWITWDDEHPAPPITVNGVEVAEWNQWQAPHAPGMVDAH